MSSRKKCHKIQEFVAHEANVNCARLGPKSGRVLATGSDDRNVNIWTVSVGKPNRVMTLSGHTSAVECLAFDLNEEFLVAGSASGTLKLWDLEQKKVARTLTGHKSNCSSVCFHPYGDFFASGSMDTNLKVWDIRRKSCIQTYRGHSEGINVVQFSPDGRWVVSGGQDGCIKVWDLTAGKMIHNFTDHTGAVTCADFHPREFLLATGSADRTVRFYDMDRLELESTAPLEATAIRAVTFHPDGDALFSATAESLKVLGWGSGDGQVTVFDSVWANWPGVADLTAVSQQLVAASYTQAFAQVWLTEVEALRPFSREEPASGGAVAAPSAAVPPSPREQRGEAPLQPPTPSRASQPPAPLATPTRNNAAAAAAAVPASSGKPPRPSTREDDAVASASGRHVSVGVGVGPSLQRQPLVAKAPPTQVPGGDQPLLPPARYSGAPTPGGSERNDIVPSEFTKPVGLDLNSFMTNSVRADLNKPAAARRPQQPLVSPPSAAPAAARLRPEQPQAAPVAAPLSVASVGMGGGGAGAAPGISEADTLAVAALSEPHMNVSGILQTRLTNLRVIRRFVAQDNVLEGMEAMLQVGDPAIFADVLGVLNGKPNGYSLDVCVKILPAVQDLLGAQFEDYVVTSLITCRVLLNNFGPTIKALTAPTPDRSSVDISKEERQEKCNYCYRFFRSTRPIVVELAKKSGKIGRAAEEVSLLLSKYITGS